MSLDPEHRARTLKAVRLADLLTAIGVKVPAICALTLERSGTVEREAYARAAGCARPPSDDTWELVIAILRDREARAGHYQGLAEVLVR